jgi:hypothetical protein
MSDTGSDDSVSDKLYESRLMAYIDTLPLEQRTPLLRQLLEIGNEKKAIEIELANQKSAPSIDERLRKMRHEVRNAIIASCWPRLLEVFMSHPEEQLNILKIKKEGKADRQLMDDTAIMIAEVKRISDPIGSSGSAAPAPKQDYSSIDPVTIIKLFNERQFQRVRRKSLNPLRLAWQLLKLEGSWWVATTVRFVAIVAFGVVIFLLAGKVHDVHPIDEAWYAILIPIAVALIELLIHRRGERFFEKWADDDRLKLNAWLSGTRRRFALEEALAAMVRARSKM